MATVPQISVFLRNDSGSTITFDGGSLAIPSGGGSVEIWDTVAYKSGISDNFQSVVDDVGVFNQNIESGDLVFVQDTVDLLPTAAFDIYHDLTLLFVSEGIDQNGFQSLVAGLPPATAVGQTLHSTDGTTLEVQDPMVSRQGWLVNDHGQLLVK
jgi:hypothetical protein